MVPKKTALVVVTFVALLLLPQVIPALASLKSFELSAIRSVWDIPLPDLPGISDQTVLEDARAQRRELLAPKNLVDPNHQMDSFYEALRKGGTVRVVHYGDSPTTADLVTGDVRALLQRQYGDAGTGFTLIARPWAWYNHRGVEMDAADWKFDIASASAARDGRFGLGGVTFFGSAGAVAHWRLKDGRHRVAEVSFQAQPDGGEFTFEADGAEVGTADTSADTAAPGYASFDLPEGSTQFALRVTRGTVRMFGVEFRKAGPGVLYSSLGVNGASVTMLSHAFNAAHWTEQLQHYNPDLVVLAYGTNESGYPQFVDTTWGGELKAAVRRVRAALPQSSILLMSPMDRGEHTKSGELDTIEALPRLVKIEQRVAEETGVAFFNTFEAMGGAGTMARWYSSEPRMVGADLIHPMPAGARIVGELLYRALQDGFNAYKLRQLREAEEGVQPAPAKSAAEGEPLK